MASRIGDVCSKFAPISVMTQDTNHKLRRAGVVTTAQVKERMRVEFQRLLRCDAVKFLEPFVSASPSATDDICSQLRNYRFEARARSLPANSQRAHADPYVPRSNAQVKEGDEKSGRGPKMYLTGKSFGKSDDLALAVQMCAFWPSTFYADGDKCVL